MISKASAEHFTWAEICDGWFLVNQPERLTVLHERMPPGTWEVRHFHRRALQFFFVLCGIATLELGGTRYTLHTQEGTAVEPGTPHQMMNLADQPMEFLVISQPNSRDDRVLVAEQDLRVLRRATHALFGAPARHRKEALAQACSGQPGRFPSSSSKDAPLQPPWPFATCVRYDEPAHVVPCPNGA
jgi:mannose-6-phosphate isomerase-like protein (cupin superfamily)